MPQGEQHSFAFWNPAFCHNWQAQPTARSLLGWRSAAGRPCHSWGRQLASMEAAAGMVQGGKELNAAGMAVD
jgi:hypothetical protein